MSGFRGKAFLFDRCGVGNPMAAEYDLDLNNPHIPLGLLKHDYTSARSPTFALPANSGFCFLIDGRPTNQAPAKAGDPIPFAIGRDRLRAMMKTNPVVLRQTVQLFSSAQEPIRHDVYVNISLF